MTVIDPFQEPSSTYFGRSLCWGCKRDAGAEIIGERLLELDCKVFGVKGRGVSDFGDVFSELTAPAVSRLAARKWVLLRRWRTFLFRLCSRTLLLGEVSGAVLAATGFAFSVGFKTVCRF